MTQLKEKTPSTSGNSTRGKATEITSNLNTPTIADIYPDRITLTPHAERYLEQLGVDLILGNCELWQLPPSLSQFWTFAHEEGRAHGHRAGMIAAGHRIERLEYEANLWYFVANNPGKRPSDYRTHQTNALWNEANQ
ncbi:MAG: hypothetical protein ACOH19_14970 [Rhodoglobus sp.]